MKSYSIPNTQWAVQLTGPDELRLNTSKPVHKPGPYQILGQVEAVGLCFSDLKLLKQYSKHARKEHIGSGIDPAILKEIPSYVPDEMPTVPGHETTVRIVAIGEKVKGVRVGARYLGGDGLPLAADDQFERLVRLQLRGGLAAISS